MGPLKLSVRIARNQGLGQEKIKKQKLSSPQSPQMRSVYMFQEIWDMIKESYEGNEGDNVRDEKAVRGGVSMWVDATFPPPPSPSKGLLSLSVERKELF